RNGDERETPTAPQRRLGDRCPGRHSRRHATRANAQAISSGVPIGRPALGRGPGTGDVPTPDGSGAADTTEGGPDTTRVCTAVHGWARARESSEAERHRGEGDGPSRAPAAGARTQAA